MVNVFHFIKSEIESIDLEINLKKMGGKELIF
jgi:hypothetical protein